MTTSAMSSVEAELRARGEMILAAREREPRGHSTAASACRGHGALAAHGGRSGEPGAAPPPRIPEFCTTFQDVIPGLSRTAYVIAPDLPGFGESDVLPSASFKAFGQAIAEVLDQLAIGPRYVYLHDFGAPVGLRIAHAGAGAGLRTNDPECQRPSNGARATVGRYAGVWVAADPGERGRRDPAPDIRGHARSMHLPAFRPMSPPESPAKAEETGAP